MIFLTARMFMVAAMIGTVAVAYANSDVAYFGDQRGSVADVPLFHWADIVQVCMTCIFATAIQFSVPTLAEASRSKRTLQNVFKVAISFSYVTNLLLGILVAVFFGQDQANSSNLFWANFHGKFFAGLISLIPALDGVAVYSLISYSLGEILLGAYYQDKVHEVDWKARTFFHLLAGIPQGLGALFVSDLVL
jgi:hypothetical protein